MTFDENETLVLNMLILKLKFKGLNALKGHFKGSVNNG